MYLDNWVMLLVGILERISVPLFRFFRDREHLGLTASTGMIDDISQIVFDEKLVLKVLEGFARSGVDRGFSNLLLVSRG